MKIKKIDKQTISPLKPILVITTLEGLPNDFVVFCIEGEIYLFHFNLGIKPAASPVRQPQMC